MKTHATKEAVDAEHRSAGAEHGALTGQLPAAAFADRRPAASALQRYQQMADESPRALQLKRQGELAAGRLHGLRDQTAAPVESAAAPVRRDAMPNHTGLPDQLKSGIESLSGLSMDHVRVHYHSPRPAQMQAHAYAQGSEIHVAPGQERHVAHEAWHIVQQAQGRVRPTVQMKGAAAINDDPGLEREADSMGEKAMHGAAAQGSTLRAMRGSGADVVQLHRGEHGLVPPSTHGRKELFTSPDNAQSTTKGQYHAVPRKHMTRFERMIDRIGRLLATELNVHVAVALDDDTLVLSANKEAADADKKLGAVAGKLKDVLNDVDPLSADLRIKDKRRTKDMDKTKRLLAGDYTDEERGVEANDEVSVQMRRLVAAINAGVISKDGYDKGAVGIYVVPTSPHESDASHNMHGELKVTDAIMERRKDAGYREKQVYVGGTLADCFACNASHKIANEAIKDLVTRNDWNFYSGGTHGGLFVGYRVSKTVAKKKARFKDLTGETVNNENIPKVDTQDAPNSSYHDDSESEAEDVDALSDYAAERNKLIGVQQSLKKSRQQLDTLARQIAAARIEQQHLEAELSTLTALVTSEPHRQQLAKARDDLRQGQASSEAAQQLVVQRRQEVETAEANYQAVMRDIRADSVVTPRRKRGIAVTFGKKLSVGNWQPGQGPKNEEAALVKLDEQYKYSTAWEERTSAPEKLRDAQDKAQDADRAAQQLAQLLEAAEAPSRRLAALPGAIEDVVGKIKQLTAEHSQTQEDIGVSAEKEPTAKARRKHAASQKKVSDVRGKLDWLNEASVSADQADGD